MELSRLKRLGAIAGAMVTASCGREPAPPAKEPPHMMVAAAVAAPPAPVAEEPRDAAPQPVEFEEAWRGFGVPKCSYLAPKNDFIGPDGAVDVVFHFHAGQMSNRELRASGVRGVFVSCGYGIGTGGYSKAFEEPKRFGWMLGRLMKTIARDAHDRRHPAPSPHLGRLALASWSAGFASVNKILAVPEWYAKADAVILLDSLHAQYVGPEHQVDVKMLRRFIQFAGDAAAGKKTMVITHSSIIPPDYASTAESTAALLTEIGLAEARPDEAPHTRFDELTQARVGAPIVAADQGGLHVRGYKGRGPHDHFDHLHRIGDALGTWVVPRWYPSKR